MRRLAEIQHDLAGDGVVSAGVDETQPPLLGDHQALPADPVQRPFSDHHTQPVIGTGFDNVGHAVQHL